MSSLDSVELFCILVHTWSCIQIRKWHIEIFPSSHDITTHQARDEKLTHKRRQHDVSVVVRNINGHHLGTRRDALRNPVWIKAECLAVRGWIGAGSFFGSRTNIHIKFGQCLFSALTMNQAGAWSQNQKTEDPKVLSFCIEEGIAVSTNSKEHFLIGCVHRRNLFTRIVSSCFVLLSFWRRILLLPPPSRPEHGMLTLDSFPSNATDIQVTPIYTIRIQNGSRNQQEIPKDDHCRQEEVIHQNQQEEHDSRNKCSSFFSPSQSCKRRGIRHGKSPKQHHFESQQEWRWEWRCQSDGSNVARKWQWLPFHWRGRRGGSREVGPETSRRQTCQSQCPKEERCREKKSRCFQPPQGIVPTCFSSTNHQEGQLRGPRLVIDRRRQRKRRGYGQGK